MGNEQWAMSNGQWAMGNGQPASQPASQWEIWRSGGRFPAVRARLPQGPKCKRSRKTHIEATFGDPGSNPESTRNRLKIDPKSTQGPPGAPRGSARTIPDAFSGPRPPPRGLQGASGGSQNRPRKTQSSRRGGSRGDLGSASGTPGTLGARRAGNFRPGSTPKRPEAAVRSDFGTIFGRFRIDFRTDCRVPATLRAESLREGPTSSLYYVFPHETQVGLCVRTAKSDRKSTENRCRSAPGASRAENRRKSSEIVESRSRNRPGGARKGRLGPLGAPLRKPRGARWG